MSHGQQYLNTVLNPSSNTFTSAQRSQQARGKPHHKPEQGEPYEARQKREQAAQILDSLELLVWYANARNETIAQTRQHFQTIQLGLPTPSALWKEEFEVPPEQRVCRNDCGDIIPPSPASRARNSSARSAKGKEKAAERDEQRRESMGRSRLWESDGGFGLGGF